MRSGSICILAGLMVINPAFAQYRCPIENTCTYFPDESPRERQTERESGPLDSRREREDPGLSDSRPQTPVKPTPTFPPPRDPGPPRTEANPFPGPFPEQLSRADALRRDRTLIERAERAVYIRKEVMELLMDIAEGGGHQTEIYARKFPEDMRDLMGEIGLCKRCAEITEAEAENLRRELSEEIKDLDREIDRFSPTVDDGGPYYANRGLFFKRKLEEILKKGSMERAERNPGPSPTSRPAPLINDAPDTLIDIFR